MLKIYGSMLCPDCVQCREDLDKAGVEYEYLDFSENLKNLKEFLVLREGPLFDAIRTEGCDCPPDGLCIQQVKVRRAHAKALVPLHPQDMHHILPQHPRSARHHDPHRRSLPMIPLLPV